MAPLQNWLLGELVSLKYFGTDGIRGKVGLSPITPEFCLRLSYAVGKTFASKGRRAHVLVGKDTRISGYMLESVIPSGLVSAGADVSLLGPMPTPAIAYLTRALSADAGIVISASHNPYYDNGIKFFDGSGNKLSDEIEQEIEARLAETLACEGSENLGRASRITDAAGRYVEFCKGSVPRDFSLRGLRIVLDCANGATYTVAPKVFEELGAEVIAFGNNPDGFNINEHCGSTHPAGLQRRVVEEGADLGIAFDGDGDRLVMVDESGRLLDGDQLLFVIARHRQQTNSMRGGVVGTVMTNLGLERALAEHSIPFLRAKVGDRHILSLLHEKNWDLGGEPSGHLLTMDLTSTGDAIVAALQVLVALRRAERSLGDLVSDVTKVPQILRNITVAEPAQLARHPVLTALVDKLSQDMSDRGRILVRASGTEPLLRIMVEGTELAEVQQVADLLEAETQTLDA